MATDGDGERSGTGARIRTLREELHRMIVDAVTRPPYQPSLDRVRRHVRETNPAERFRRNAEVLAALYRIQQAYPECGALWPRFLRRLQLLDPDRVREFVARWDTKACDTSSK